MTIALELAWRGAGAAADEVAAWFGRDVAPALARAPGLVSFDLYRPAAGRAHDPYNDDGIGPLALAMLDFADLAALEAGVASRAFRDAVGQRTAPVPLALSAAALERRFFPVAGEARPAPLAAPFSYVVRYHRPAEDEAAFRAHYQAHHPPLLGRFPRIRNVLCYVPVAWRDPVGLAAADYLIGNEVVFDTIGDFNAAMQSPVRHELRRDFATFPKFSGRNTHYPMDRRRIAP